MTITILATAALCSTVVFALNSEGWLLDGGTDSPAGSTDAVPSGSAPVLQFPNKSRELHPPNLQKEEETKSAGALPTARENAQKLWRGFQQQLQKESQALGARLEENPSEQGAIVFLGDSIFETWRGTTSMGQTCPRCNGAKPWFLSHYAPKGGVVLAISGDQTNHVLWRIGADGIPAGLGQTAAQVKNPELGPLLAKRTRAVVIHIGTNNLAFHKIQETLGDFSVKDVKAGILNILQTIDKRLPKDTPVIVLGLLPRAQKWPQNQYYPVIKKINAELKTLLDEEDKTRFQNIKLNVIECGSPLLASNSPKINVTLMPDLLHPTAEGLELIARKCIDPALGTLMST